MGMEKVVAIVLLKAVLLGGPQGPEVMWNDSGPPSVLTAESARARLAYVLRGDKLSHDSTAGLTVLIGPDAETVRVLFEEVGAQSLRDVLLEAGQAAEWPECRFEFPLPTTGPAYYLEAAGTDLYRRVELADKAGYLGSVLPVGALGGLAANVEFQRKVLSGGQYDETIRAYLGRPVIIANVVTATVPVEPGKPTLLIWHGDRQASRRAQAGEPGAALTPEQRDLGLERETLLKAFQAARAQIAAELAAKEAALTETLKTHTENHPAVQALKAQIAFLREKLAELQGPAAGPAEAAGPPAWAVGKWELRSPDGDEVPIMTVARNGAVTIEGEAGAIPGAGSVDGQGCVQFRLMGAEGGKPEAVLTGQLNRDGTGSGTVPEENETWTATRVEGGEPPAQREAQTGEPLTPAPVVRGEQRIEFQPPEGGGEGLVVPGEAGTEFHIPIPYRVEIPSPPAFDYGRGGLVTDPRAQASPASQGPSGLAVLVEVRAPSVGAVPEQQREGFQAVASALAKAGGGRAQLDLTAASVATIPGQRAEGAGLVTVVPVKSQAGQGNPPTVTLVEGEQYVPLAAFGSSGSVAYSQTAIGSRESIELPPGVCLVAVRPDETGRGFAVFAVDAHTGRLEHVHAVEVVAEKLSKLVAEVAGVALAFKDGVWLESVSALTGAGASAAPEAFALFDRWLYPNVARCQVLMRYADGQGSHRLRLWLDVPTGPLAGHGQ